MHGNYGHLSYCWITSKNLKAFYLDLWRNDSCCLACVIWSLPYSYKPNSITLASSDLAPNVLGASSEHSVMEFGFIQQLTISDKSLSIDQWRKRLRACVRANIGPFERLLWTNLHFHFQLFLVQVASVHLARLLLCWCLMADRPTLLNCKV